MIKDKFQKEIKKFIDKKYEYVVVKPNWISNVDLRFTSAKVLDWLLECFPSSKKIVVESYTAWRGFDCGEDAKFLEKVENNIEDYRKADILFLKEKGFDKIFEKYDVEYVNVTEEFCCGDCVLVDGFEYVPKKIFEIKDDTLFVDLTRLKFNVEGNIFLSGAVKNFFGLYPHPNRSKLHQNLFENIKLVYDVYDKLFVNKLFVVESFRGMIKDYWLEKVDDGEVVDYNNKFYVGRDGIELDREICEDFDIDWRKIDYLKK